MSQFVCAFCTKSAKDYKELNFVQFDHSHVTICEECLAPLHLAFQQIESIQEKKVSGATNQVVDDLVISKENIPFPDDIQEYLSKYIIGNEKAKIDLSIAIAHHYRRFLDPSISKSNILLIGPTGTGKTEFGRTIAGFLNVPFVSADATNFTSKGYVGEDVESMLSRLLAACDWNVSKAEKGIILIDEIDKIAKKDTGSGDLGVNSEKVQQELLKILEGDKIKVSRKTKTPGVEETFFVDTSQILFICAGAFVGLEESIKKDSKKGQIGLNSKAENTTTPVDEYWGDAIETEHLKKFGLIPEFLGRLPVVTTTNELRQEDLERIITEPANSISKQYTNLFKIDDITVNFSKEFVSSVAKEALAKKLGARGLRSIFEKRIKKVSFNMKKYKNKTVRFTSDSYEEVANLQ